MGPPNGISIPMLLLSCCATTILAGLSPKNCEDLKKVSSPLTRLPFTTLRKCTPMKQGEIDQAIYEMKMVDKIKFETFDELFVLLVDEYGTDSESIVKFLTHNKTTSFNLEKPENEETMDGRHILRIAQENIRLYSEGRRAYFIFKRGLRSKYDVFKRYFLKKVIENTKEKFIVSYMIYLTNRSDRRKIAAKLNDLKPEDASYSHYKEYFEGQILEYGQSLELYHYGIRLYSLSPYRNERLLFKVFECLEIHVLENLTSDFKSLVKNMHDHYLESERDNYEDAKETSRLLWQGSEQLSKIEKIISSYMDHVKKQSIETLMDAFRTLGINFPSAVHSRFLRNLDAFLSLRSATGVKIEANQLVDPLKNIIENNIKLSASWYEDLDYLITSASHCLSDKNITEPVLEAFPKHIYSKADNPDVKEKALAFVENQIRHREIKPECISWREHHLQIQTDTIRLRDVPEIAKVLKVLLTSTRVAGESCRRVGPYEFEDIDYLIELTDRIALREYDRLLIFISEDYKEPLRIFAKGRVVYYVYSKKDTTKNEVYAGSLAKVLSTDDPEIRIIENDTLLHEIRRGINLPTNQPIDEVEKIFSAPPEVVDASFLHSTPNEPLRKVIKCLNSGLLQNTISVYDSLAESINLHNSKLSVNSKDLNDLLSELEFGKQTLSDALKEMQNRIDHASDLGSIPDPLENGLYSLKIDVSEDVIPKLSKSFNVFNVLNSLGPKVNWQKSKLFRPLRDIISNIGKSITWYKNVNDLYQNPIPYWKNNLHTNARLLEFKFLEIELDASKDSEGEQKALNDIQEIVFGQTKECTWMEVEKVYKLQFRGKIIRTRDIPDEWFDLCKGTIRILELFARHQIIIDKDFNSSGRTLQFEAIAPEILVVGNRTIRLDGGPGQEQVKPEIASFEESGTDGLAGLPGESGGIFIGISGKTINGSMLRISADGGPGGPGQEGGQGGEVLTPKLPTKDKYDLIVFAEVNIKDGSFGHNNKIEEVYNYLRFATGTTGGDGGKGGQGGEPGRIEFYELNQMPKEYPSPHPGRPGPDGRGGKGGTGSYSMKQFKFDYDDLFNNTHVHAHCDESCLFRNGTDGETGQSKNVMKPPYQLKGLRDFSLVVNDYKNSIRPFLRKSKETDVLSQFHVRLMNDKNVNNKYGTLAYFNELEGLVEQSICLREIVDTVPMYNNLRKRIQEYKNHPRESKSINEHVAALVYAETAIVIISSRLKENFSFLTDLLAYIEVVQKDLDSLRNNQIVYSANQLSKDYQSDIEVKVEEARIAIDSQLRQVIVKLNKQMKVKLSELYREVEDVGDDYKEKLTALEKINKTRKIYSIVKTFLVVAAAVAAVFLPGAGVAIAIAVTVTHIAEPLFTSDPAAEVNLQLPGGVVDSFARVSKMRSLPNLLKQKASLDSKIMKLESQFLNSFKRSDKELRILEDLREAIKSNLTNLKAEEKGLLLQIEEMSQEKKKNGYSLGIKDLSDAGNKLDIIFQRKKWNHAIPKSLESTTEKLKEEEKSIKAAEDDLKKLDEYQKRIYGEFMPMLDNMFQNLPADENLSGKSKVGLDVSKWKLQAALKKVQIIVKQFTQGFRVADEINLIIESVSDTMDTLINLYNQIQNYQQEKNLVSYIKELNNNQFREFEWKDVTVQKFMLDALILIKKNLALMQYNRVFEAYKQFIFPFAEELEELAKPADLELIQKEGNSSIDDQLISAISKNIESITKKIKTTHSSMSSNPKFLQPLVYGMKHGGPVYTWKNESYSGMISDLLSGKEVILSPDVKTFPHYALKARQFRISFIAINEEDQEALDEKLKPFRMMMTHMGFSHYKCGQEIYLITHKSFTLEEFFDRDHIGQNENAAKSSNGFDLASPFTVWRVQLTGYVDDLQEDDLSDFKNKVDLVLEAPRAAFHLKRNSESVCNNQTDLSQYFGTFVSTHS